MSLPLRISVNNRTQMTDLAQRVRFYLSSFTHNDTNIADYRTLQLIYEVLENLLPDWPNDTEAQLSVYNYKKNNILAGMIEQLPPLYYDSYSHDLIAALQDSLQNEKMVHNFGDAQSAYHDFSTTKPAVKEASEKIFNKDEFEQNYLVYKKFETLLESEKTVGKSLVSRNSKIFVFENIGQVLKKWSSVCNTPKEKAFLKEKDIAIKKILKSVPDINNDTEFGKILFLLKRGYAEVDISSAAQQENHIKRPPKKPHKIAGMINAYHLKKSPNKKLIIEDNKNFEQQWRYSSQQLLERAGENGNDTRFIDFKLTEKSKALFSQGKPEQGYIGVSNLLTGEVHLFPCFNLSEEEANKINENLGIKASLQSNFEQRQAEADKIFLSGDRILNKKGERFHFNDEIDRCTVCVADPLGGNSGQAHQTAIKYIGYSDEERENLVGFGVFKGGKESMDLLDQFRERSASINIPNFIYNDAAKNIELARQINTMIEAKRKEISEALRHDIEVKRKNKEDEKRKALFDEMYLEVLVLVKSGIGQAADERIKALKINFDRQSEMISEEIRRAFSGQLEKSLNERMAHESKVIKTKINADILNRYNRQKRSMPKEISDKLLHCLISGLPLEHNMVRDIQYDLRGPLGFSSIKNVILAGDVDALKNLIDKGHHVNQHFVKEIYTDEVVILSPLQACMEMNNHEMIAMLLRHPDISLDDEAPSFFEWFYKETPVSEIDKNLIKFYSAMSGEKALAFALKSNRMHLVNMALAQMNETLESVDVMPFLQQGFKLFKDADLKHPADNEFKEFIFEKADESVFELDAQIENFLEQFNKEKELLFSEIDCDQDIDIIRESASQVLDKLNTVSRREETANIIKKHKVLLAVGKKILTKTAFNTLNTQLDLKLESLYAVDKNVDKAVDAFLSRVEQSAENSRSRRRGR